MVPLLALYDSGEIENAASMAVCLIGLDRSRPIVSDCLHRQHGHKCGGGPIRQIKVLQTQSEPVSLNTNPSVMAPATSVAVSVGASLVPVMVTVTSWVAVPPFLIIDRHGKDCRDRLTLG